MSPRHLNLPNLRAAWWTIRAVREAKRKLAAGDLDSIALPSVPRLPASAERGVNGVLRRTDARCLVRALVRQAWFASQGIRRDLVVGVTPPAAGFEAHAWLDGDPECHDEHFRELLRRPSSA